MNMMMIGGFALPALVLRNPLSIPNWPSPRYYHQEAYEKSGEVRRAALEELRQVSSPSRQVRRQIKRLEAAL